MGPSDDREGTSWGRVLAVAGGVAAVLVVGAIVVVLLGGGESATKAPSTLGTTPTGQPGPKGLGASATSAPVVRADTTTSVLNGTVQAGLAGRLASKLQKAGFKKPETDTNPDQTLPKTVVYFTAGNEPAAGAVARAIGVSTSAVKPIDRDVAVSSPGAQVVVTVGADLTG